MTGKRWVEMPFKDRVTISVREGTKVEARKAKNDLNLTYDEFLQKAASELTEP